MECANNEFFQVQYNTKLNRLQIKEEGWTSKLGNAIKRHKFFTTIVIAFLLFSMINVIMICSFFNILQNFM